MSAQTAGTSATFIKSFTLGSIERVQPTDPAPGSALHVVCVDPAEPGESLTPDLR